MRFTARIPWMDCQGNRQCRRQRPVLHRSHDQRVFPGDLGCQTLPVLVIFGHMTCSLDRLRRKLPCASCSA